MITAIEPNVKPLGRYPKTQTAELLGIHINTLSNYITLGYITPLPKKPGTKGIRFLGRDIIRLWKAMT